MSERMQTFMAIIAVSCAVVTTGMVVTRELRSGDTGETSREAVVENVGQIIASAPHISGPADADVTFIEFFDFQCPACRMLAASMDSVIASGEMSIRIARHHYPLTRAHPTAQDLALAGLCLDDSEQFEEYYHRAFANQAVLGSEGSIGPLSVMPEGVDTSAVRRCMGEQTTWDKLAAELELGRSLRLQATPSYIIHGRLYWGALGAADLTRLLKERP
jgi:protein-disulfide isomerase